MPRLRRPPAWLYLLAWLLALALFRAVVAVHPAKAGPEPLIYHGGSPWDDEDWYEIKAYAPLH